VSKRLVPTAVLSFLFATGCAAKPEPTILDTGARSTAETFYGALIANEPSRAYATLDQESKIRVSADQFAGLARAYAKNIGFQVERVHIHASDEQGDAATVHVTLAGRAAGHSRRYSDGITLHRNGGQWGIVLPTNFGQKAR
jgi:hypothetical protein